MHACYSASQLSTLLCALSQHSNQHSMRFASACRNKVHSQAQRLLASTEGALQAVGMTMPACCLSTLSSLAPYYMSCPNASHTLSLLAAFNTQLLQLRLGGMLQPHPRLYPHCYDLSLIDCVYAVVVSCVLQGL